MRPILIAFTFLAAGAAFAQAPGNNAFGCPVGISARHQGSPAAIWTTSLEDQNKSAAELKALHTGVHVHLDAPHKEIKQAELDVFFLPPGTRALPVKGSQFAPSSAPPPETHKNFSLATNSASHRLDGDLLLGPVASVTHISLMRLTYTDGTEWSAHSPTSCSVKPSLFMPVQAK
jgi:hypothetical protein